MVYGDSVSVGKVVGRYSSSVRDKVYQLRDFPTKQESMKIDAMKKLIKMERAKKGV
jgi:hypothetical protein